MATHSEMRAELDEIRKDDAGLVDCVKCGKTSHYDDTEDVYVPCSLMQGGYQKERHCKECAPRCAVCDGLLDDATLFDLAMRGRHGEASVGMGVAVAVSTCWDERVVREKMHGSCFAALMLFGEYADPIYFHGYEDLAMLGMEEIGKLYKQEMAA